MRPAALLLGVLACNSGGSPDKAPGSSDEPLTDTTAASDTDTTADGDVDGDGSPASADCDDADASIHPGAEETWYDGVDSNCDGADDFDADGDGAIATAFGGGDCDDVDPARYAGAPRVCGNGVDDDCDLMPDCDLRGEVVYEDVVAGQVTVAQAKDAYFQDVGDVDGDGEIDVLLGSGRAQASWLFRGPLLDIREDGQEDGVYLGEHATLGDFDGDGLDDLATTLTPLGGISLTQIWSSAGALAGDPPIARLVYGLGEGTWIDRTEAADVDDDGFEDLVVLPFPNCEGVVDAPSDSECVRVTHGPFAGDLDVTAVDTHIVSADKLFGQVGTAGIHGGVDLTGDGVSDLLIPDKFDYPIYYVVEGPLPPTVWLEHDVNITMLPTGDFDAMFVIRPTAGDFDGDGYADLVTGAYGPSPASVGAVWIFRGPLTGPVTDLDAWVTAGGIQPFSVAAAGDMDGDGAADLAVAATARDPVTDENLYPTLLFYAPEGAVEPDATLTFAERENATTAVLPLGDVDGDGLADLLAAGAMRDSAGVECGGAVTLLGLPTGF